VSPYHVALFQFPLALIGSDGGDELLQMLHRIELIRITIFHLANDLREGDAASEAILGEGARLEGRV
jgi:hypothetical protein